MFFTLMWLLSTILLVLQAYGACLSDVADTTTNVEHDVIAIAVHCQQRGTTSRDAPKSVRA